MQPEGVPAKETIQLYREGSDPVSTRSLHLPANGTESTSLAGAVDAFFENEIIDYKITSKDNTPPGLYESQLDFYALVVNMMTGAENVKASIAFLKEGKIETRVITDFESIRERVIKAAEECACGEYMPNHKNCGLCPYKKGCVNCNAGVQE